MKRADRFPAGLRFKLAAGVLLVVVVSLALLSLAVLRTIRTEFLGEILSRADIHARSVERSIRLQAARTPLTGPTPEDEPSLTDLLLVFSDEEHLVGLRLLDPEGRELAQQGRWTDLPLDGWRRTPGGNDYLFQGGDRPLLAVRASLATTPTLGLVTLWSLERVNRVIALIQARTVFQIALSALVLFLVLLGVLTYTVIRPLQELARGMGRVSGGNLDTRVDLASGDELGYLAASFNAMTAALKESRETIGLQLRDLQRAHRETVEARDRFIAAEKMASLGTLAAGVAHEVGNPLGAVTGYVELLASGRIPPAEQEDMLRRTAAELNRIHLIMLELLNYARPSAEPSAPLDVNALVRDLLDSLRSEGALGGMEVHLDLAEGLPCPVGFPHKLEQVLTNLVRNAVWAAEPKGTLTVTTRSLPGAREGVEMTFADDGRGIPPESLGRVFDPFFTTRLGQGGTGLGLAVSRRIIEEMGGTIEVSSEPGVRTAFVIGLPVHELLVPGTNNSCTCG